MGEKRSLLARRRRPFVQSEQRAGDAHIQIYISQLNHFQMPVSSIVFPAATKKSCWHAACLRGVIHHFRRKEAHDEYIQKDLFTCVHYFNFNFSCSQPPDISVHLKLPLVHPSESNAGKKKERSNEVHVWQWFHIQLTKSISSLHRLKIKRNDLLMLLIKRLHFLRSGDIKQKHKKLLWFCSTTTDLFLLTNIYLTVWDHRDAALFIGWISL